MVGGGLRGLRLFRLENGHITYYEDEESMRRAEAELDSMADVVRVCDACFRIFISEQALRKHAEDFHSEPKSTEPIQYLEKEDHELEPPELAMQYGNLEQEMDDDSDMPFINVEAAPPHFDRKFVGRFKRKLPPNEIADEQKAEALNNFSDSEYMEAGRKPNQKVAGSNEEDGVKPVVVKKLKKDQGQRLNQPSTKGLQTMKTDDLEKSSGNVERKFWCKQRYCDTFHPSIEALRAHVTKAHRGVDASEINEHNYCTYGLGIGPPPNFRVSNL